MQKLLLYKLFITLSILFFIKNISTAQERSTEGTDFWMGFMENFTAPEAMDLFITSKSDASGTITIGNPDSPIWSTNFTVLANGTTTVTLNSAAYTTFNLTGSQGGGIRETGVHITSDNPISVSAINNRENSTDATVVLPSLAIGAQLRYIVSSYDAGSGGIYPSQILVVAIDDNDEDIPIKLTLPDGTVVLSQSMKIEEGESYIFQADFDLTGTIVESLNPCNSFAVFAGVAATNITAGCGNLEHAYAQQYPVKTWEREYYVTPFGIGVDDGGNSVEQNGYVLRIIRDDLSTTANLNGSPISWNNGRFHDIEMGREDVYIDADQPISVTQYMKGQACNGLPKIFGGGTLAKGDPAQIVLNPSAQTVNSAIFSTTTTTNLTDHFVNVIVKTEDIGIVSLDGTTVNASEFVPFSSDSDYSYAIFQIEEGSHTVECANGLIAYCYGIGERESYAYTVGARFEDFGYAIDLSTDFTDPGLGDDAFGCVGEAVNFDGLGDNVIAYSWDFGDGSPIETDAMPSHTYTTSGEYTVIFTATVQDDEGCEGGDTREVIRERTITILDFPSEPNIAEGNAICISEGTSTGLTISNFDNSLAYEWFKDDVSLGETGQNITIDEEGNYKVTVTNQGGCGIESATTILNFNPTPSFIDDEATYCTSTGFINLFESVAEAYNNPSNGSFSIGINSITDPSNFDPTNDPAVGGLDNYTLTFTYTADAGCSETATQSIVIQEGFVNFTIAPENYEYCESDDASINLFDVIDAPDPNNGEFEVNGSVLSLSEAQAFNPVDYASISPFKIKYTYFENDCIARTEDFIIYSNPTPTFDASNIILCLNDTYNITSIFTPSNSTNDIEYTIGGTVVSNPNNIIASDFANAGESFEIIATETFTSTSGFVSCSNSTSKTINIRPTASLINNVSEGQNFCRNDAPTLLTVNASIEGIFSVSIDGGSFTNLLDAIFDPSTIEVAEGETKPVTLRFTDICGESFDINIFVQEFTLFEDSNIYEICAENGETVQLDALEILEENGVNPQSATYEWSTGEENNTQITATNPDIDYFVNVEASGECPIKITFRVNHREDCTPSFGLPTAFSPNGDGLNDVLEIQGQFFEKFEIIIFNRWGEMVFTANKSFLFVGSSDNSELFWDGKIRGKDAPEGTYICKIKYQLPNSPKVQKTQKLTLIR